MAIALTFASFRLAKESFRIAEATLRNNQESIRIGQRAYISMKSGKFRVEGLEVGWPPPKVEAGGKPVYAVGSLLAEFQIVNDGNTLADLLRLTFAVEAAERWDLLSYQTSSLKPGSAITEVHQGVGRIGPHSSALHKYGWQMTVPIELTGAVLFERTMERSSGHVMPGISMVRLRAEMLARNVFGETDLVSWCWYPSWAGNWPLTC